MIPDDETLIAYADGELDAVAAKRVEQALAADPALAAEVSRQRALREHLGQGFARIAAAPVPAALRAQLALNVVPLRAAAPARRRWFEAAAIAATLVLGVAVGREWPAGPLQQGDGRLAARGSLAAALDDQLSGGGGAIRVLASFRAADGGYCRVFAAQGTDGIACRDAAGWAIRRTQAAAPAATGAYRQAAAPAAAVMAAAQDMMAGDPLDPAAERAARAADWR